MRTHISAKSNIGNIRPKARQNINHKPVGFWYGVNGDWERWCRAEEWGLDDGMFEHEVILGDESILVLSSVDDIDRFHIKYGTEIVPRTRYINWAKVAKDFDGIEIAPYQWSRRMTHSWYYTWDCASGCVWRPRGMQLKFLKKVDAIRKYV